MTTTAYLAYTCPNVVCDGHGRTWPVEVDLATGAAVDEAEGRCPDCYAEGVPAPHPAP